MSPWRCSHSLGIEAPADGEHLLREVDQRQREPRFQVDGVVAAAAPELEDLSHWDRG